jgi:hypothetical protein
MAEPLLGALPPAPAAAAAALASPLLSVIRDQDLEDQQEVKQRIKGRRPLPIQNLSGQPEPLRY